MLLRKPVEDVYQALVDPTITTKFWFTKSSGKLEMGKRIRWEWEMYAAASTVEVKHIDSGRRIALEWGLDDRPSLVEWTFTRHGNQGTYVSVTNSGFSGDGDAVVEQAMDSAAGFTLVLAGLKAYLEYGIELNLIADRFPDQIVSPEKAHGSKR